MAIMLGDIALMPGSLIAWVLVGLISGWVAGQVMNGGGFGLVGDILVGLVGAMIGGFAVSFIDQGVSGFWGSVFVSIVGASIFLAITRVLVGRRMA